MSKRYRSWLGGAGGVPVLALILGLTAGAPRGVEAYWVAPDSKENVVHLDVYRPDGDLSDLSVRAEVLEHPAWVEGVAVTTRDGSLAETSVAFDVAPATEIGAGGDLVVRLRGIDRSGRELVSVDRHLRLEVQADAPAEQRSFRVDECCLLSTGIEEASPGVPARNILLDNAPNPFNPLTRIRFGLSAGGSVIMRVYDVSGRTVRTMESPELPAGYHQIAWNGTDDGGRAVPSGAYFCELSSGDWSATQKVLLIR